MPTSYETRTTPKSTVQTDNPSTQRAFRTAKHILRIYVILSALVLLTDGVIAATGHGAAVSSFMWGRAGGVAASAAVTYWFTVLAARGASWAYVRVRIISIAMPFLIVGLVLIPGVAQPWFVVSQVVCAFSIAAAAVFINSRKLRAVFATR